tara:strand:+ start:5061 stop:5453 length:393 start_codon:yes stop_codon:yes gene_type:complete
MFLIIGYVVVIGAVLGGYLPHGKFSVLVQPFEVVIIFGAAFGTFLIANPISVLKRSISFTIRAMKGAKKNLLIWNCLSVYTLFSGSRNPKAILRLKATSKILRVRRCLTISPVLRPIIMRWNFYATICAC